MRLFLILYEALSIFMSGISLWIAYKAFQQRSKSGRCFGWACLMAATVNMTYMLSVFQTEYLPISILSSMYFFSIDVMLIFLIGYIIYYTAEDKRSKRLNAMLHIGMAYGAVDGIVLAINPFREIVLSYEIGSGDFAIFTYKMNTLYVFHLIYTYLMVLFFVALIIRKMFHVPREYRRTYWRCLISIFFIVAVNGSFLFMKMPTILGSLDLSVLGYSAGLAFLYWSSFVYPKQGMVNELRSTIIDSLDRGIVMFGFDNKLLLANDIAKRILPEHSVTNDMNLEQFLYECQLPFIQDDAVEYQSVQVYMNDNDPNKPTRCDFRVIRNDIGEITGRLLLFTDAALESDLLTGFQNWDYFCKYVEDTQQMAHADGVVAILDINGLALINSSRGRNFGDQAIQFLADLMRKTFPQGTYFVRGEEANLIALTGGVTEKEILDCIQKIEAQFEHNLQYAVARYEREKENVLSVINETYKGLRAKKLMDKNSNRSHMLTSLIQALQGCDADTEEHVKRTQQMGALLGKRIGLSDVEQSHLSLLCILHDIGKIGIPLDILNKPGKLTDQEWKTIQSHVGKGYQIANSTKEFADIADMILHHHERWDGKGYPDGMARESIPLLSRVIAVVDAYDAMVNDRSYRKALPISVAKEEIRKNAGTQFDPYISSEFLQLIEENPFFENHKEEKVQKAEPKPQNDEAKNSLGYEESVLKSVHIVPFCRYILDANMRIITVNDRFEPLTGYTMEDIQNNVITQFDLLPESDRAEYISSVTRELANKPSSYFEHRIQRKDGTIIYVFCFGRMFYDSAAREQCSEVIVTNMADFYSIRTVANEERSRVQTQMAQWETTYRRDALTGLLNRAAFVNDVEERLIRRDRKALILMIDVDKFKAYNDTYGHQAGDEYLMIIGQTLSSALRKDDLACRMGGDEFAAALFFGDNSDDQLMYDRTQQVFDKINMLLASHNTKCSISMGAAISNENWCTFKKLYQAADNALYRAKEQGRGCLKIQYPGDPFEKGNEEIGETK